MWWLIVLGTLAVVAFCANAIFGDPWNGFGPSFEELGNDISRMSAGEQATIRAMESNPRLKQWKEHLAAKDEKEKLDLANRVKYIEVTPRVKTFLQGNGRLFRDDHQ